MHVDILIAGDFRFPGGTSTSVAAEARVLAAAGYRLAFLSLATGPLSPRRGMHPEILALVRSGAASFVPQHQPVEAALCLLHHPAAFATLPAVGPLVTSRRTLLVVHHPAIDGAGVPQYDVPTISAQVEALYGPVVWAPVGPKVRATLEGLASPPPLTPEDWVNIIDPAEWADPAPRPLPRARPVLGRHSRPDAAKWPGDRDSFLGAYPDASDLDVRLLGWSDALDAVTGPRPANWEVLPFGALPARDFLRSLDYFSYFHGPDWIEAFGRSILEAMATGLVCLLPPHFQPLFGDAAVYCEPEGVLAEVRRLEQDPEARALLSGRARQAVQDRFGPDCAIARVAALIGPPSAAVTEPAGTLAKVRPRILYFTSNGVGMGHLARCLATARRLRQARPVIVTMSKAFPVVRDEGVTVEYLPYFKSIGLEPEVWNEKLFQELTEIFDYHGPDVVVFDGNVPYDGLLAALDLRPQIWRVWQRRAMWSPGAGEDHLARAETFDVVIEPGELAAPVDRGLTTAFSADCFRVPPIRVLDREETLSASAAKALLGLDPDRHAVLLQLGSGNNYDLRAAAHIVFELAEERPDLQVVYARWRISEAMPPLPDHVLVLDTFPIARHLAAFDFAVATAGYNTFHENIAAALPTLFVGNESPEQDEQWLRAHYAALRGLALAARAHDLHAIRRGIGAMLDPRTRARLSAACRALDLGNGAEAAASFLDGLCLTRKPSALPFRPLPREVTG